MKFNPKELQAVPDSLKRFEVYGTAGMLSGSMKCGDCICGFCIEFYGKFPPMETADEKAELAEKIARAYRRHYTTTPREPLTSALVDEGLTASHASAYFRQLK